MWVKRVESLYSLRVQKTCNHDEGMSPVAHADDLVCVRLPHSALIQHTDIGFEKMKETAVD